ncbi:MAG TPA: heme lyase CcmF/NrfE family subunit [Alphaproteobacteria bacterium]
MIIELAHFSMILALLAAILQSVYGLNNNSLGDIIAQRAALALNTLIMIAFSGLVFAYVTSDFSVINVILNSHTDKPMLYKIAGAWGNHEGSMLLWILMLASFGSFIAVSPQIKDHLLRRRALGIQGLLSVGFIAFSFFTSNPFLRTNMVPENGQSLNPVLQDPGLAFHPPTLYLGYVGFSAVFSLAAAALLTGRVDTAWAKMVKPFAALAWLALSAGIALGSRWAYYELGWGGFWYWDPVENASLLPWLAGTALLHSLLVLEARGALKRWTILLAVITFCMSLLGTFLVRSGVLTSVHAFAVDPARGIFILALLFIYSAGAFILYAWRAPSLKTLRLFTPISRESSLVANNLLLITILVTVLTGTLYPLIMDTFHLQQLSVGAPYYNATIVPIAIPLLLLMGIGPFLPWKRVGRFTFKKSLLQAAAIAIGLTLLFVFTDHMTGIIGLAAALWLMVASVLQWRPHMGLKNWSLVIGHFGLGLAIIGMIGTSLWKVEDIRVANPGDRFEIGGYSLRFDGVKQVEGPNYTAAQADVSLLNSAGPYDVLHPQRRWYPVSNSDTTEAAIRLTFLKDLYVVLGTQDAQSSKDAWVLRTWIHPFVSALWAGFAMIVLAGILMLIRSTREAA